MIRLPDDKVGALPHGRSPRFARHQCQIRTPPNQRVAKYTDRAIRSSTSELPDSFLRCAVAVPNRKKKDGSNKREFNWKNHRLTLPMSRPDYLPVTHSLLLGNPPVPSQTAFAGNREKILWLSTRCQSKGKRGRKRGHSALFDATRIESRAFHACADRSG